MHAHTRTHACTHAGRTLLDDRELEMLVILRINRAFMEYMGKNYTHLIKDYLKANWPSTSDTKD